MSRRKKMFDPRKFAVVIVAMQDVFLSEVQEAVRLQLIENMIKLIRQCAELDIPIVSVTNTSSEEIIPELAREIRRVPRRSFLEKTKMDAFYGTPLDAKLRQWKSETLLIVGIHAALCVWSTVFTASELGYNVLASKALMAENDYHTFYPHTLQSFEEDAELLDDVPNLGMLESVLNSE